MLALPPTLLDIETDGREDPFHIDGFEYVSRGCNRDNYTILIGNTTNDS